MSIGRWPMELPPSDAASRGPAEASDAGPDGRQTDAVCRLVIVTPVFEDWDSFTRLIREIDQVLDQRRVRCRIVAVDDGSTTMLQEEQIAGCALSNIEAVEILRLVCNLGHQRAIAVGLVAAAKSGGCDAVVVMDCDGEDRPDDLPRLLQCFREAPDRIAVARRVKRSEGLGFRAFYLIYKLMFRLLTGKAISFGNYCLIPASVLNRTTFMPETWNNLASALTRSRLPLQQIGTNRGQRYAGRSKMNTVSLIVHGLSALSVYSDVAFVRMLLSALALAGLTVLGIGTAVGIKFFSDLAIPGWTTDVVGSLLIVLLQAVMLLFGVAFLLLNSRSSPSSIPALIAEDYIWMRTVVFAK